MGLLLREVGHFVGSYFYVFFLRRPTAWIFRRRLPFPFSYLEQPGSLCLFFYDPTSSDVDAKFPDTSGWSEFNEAPEEPIPSVVPVPLGVPVLMTCLVDASHASITVTLRSYTGIFVKLRGAPI